ncbi:MAG: hypothetical protein VKK04_12805 [Synechococcales bacterium]|nr:hypothetical protein [Synechococcales bacterium]
MNVRSPLSLPADYPNSMMAFEDDIFISYTHIDNQPLTEGQKGWISHFHHCLKLRLAQLRGKEAKIWLDTRRISGNDYIEPSIVQRLPKVALLVSIFTPRYLQSEWCMRELREFCQAAQRMGGLRIGEKSRLFKVIKTPIEREQHPPETQDLLGYEFFQMDASGRPVEFDPIFGEEAEKRFLMRLYDVAYDAHRLLDTLSRPESQVAPDAVDGGAIAPPASDRPPIYLAETTSDLRDARDNIRRELQQRGYLVLPDEALPHSPDFSEAVITHLCRCRLSIHLVGRRYGIVPEGAEQSVVELQHTLATAHQRQNGDFDRLVWMPVGLEAEEARQQDFIQALQDQAELLQTGLEDFKTLIQDTLHSSRSGGNALQAEAHPPQVYLICDQRDQDDYEATLQPIEDYLWDQGYEVIPSVFDGDEAEIRRYHEGSLVDCDAVLIYYGAGSELWVQTKLKELRKASGLGRSHPFWAKAVYVSGESTPAKQRFRTREAEVINQFGDFSPSDLAPFVTQVNQAAAGRSQ